jgi:crotonobetaine/carnitine-CoA ligase
VPTEGRLEEKERAMAEQFEIGPETTFGELMKHKAESVGEKVFLTYIRDFDKNVEERYTYRDMHLRSNRLGNGLKRLGLERGDGISLIEINSPEFLFTLFGAVKLGAYTVLVNVGLKGDSLQYIIDHSDSKVVVIHWTLLESYRAIRDQLPKVQHVVVDVNEAPRDYRLPEGMISLRELMEAPEDDIDTKPELGDMSLLIYTSGTTGLPKATTFLYGRTFMGVALHAPMFIAHMMGRPGDVLYTCLPLFHGNALQLTSLPGFAAEFPVILSKRFSASRFWDIIRKYGVTNFNLLGSMPHFLLKQPEKPNDKDNRVWRVNSAACPKELIEKFENRFGVKVYEGYGAVDGGGFMLGTFGRENIPVGTMGMPPDGVTAEIMDDDGNLLGPDEPGELVFHVKDEEREQRKVVYYKDEEAGKSRIQGGSDGRLWFHTGDLATKDRDGWFYFVDRKKDAIRRRGENIAAWSVERVVNQHEKVLESAAYGVKSEEYGEDEVMVAVVLRPGERLTPEELLDFCQDKMANFMIPRFIDFVEKLPKSEVHRIMKRFLKDRGVTEATYDREKAGYENPKG